MIAQYVAWALFIIYAILAFAFCYNSFDGLVSGLVTSILIGALLAGLTLYFWKVTLVIVILAGLGKIADCDSSEGRIAVGIITAIVAVMIVIAGKGAVKEAEKKEVNAQTQQYVLNEPGVYGHGTGNYETRI